MEVKLDKLQYNSPSPTRYARYLYYLKRRRVFRISPLCHSVDLFSSSYRFTGFYATGSRSPCPSISSDRKKTKHSPLPRSLSHRIHPRHPERSAAPASHSCTSRRRSTTSTLPQHLQPSVNLRISTPRKCHHRIPISTQIPELAEIPAAAAPSSLPAGSDQRLLYRRPDGLTWTSTWLRSQFLRLTAALS
jgi:hypothetical protein